MAQLLILYHVSNLLRHQSHQLTGASVKARSTPSLAARSAEIPPPSLAWEASPSSPTTSSRHSIPNSPTHCCRVAAKLATLQAAAPAFACQRTGRFRLWQAPICHWDSQLYLQVCQRSIGNVFPGRACPAQSWTRCFPDSVAFTAALLFRSWRLMNARISCDPTPPTYPVVKKGRQQQQRKREQQQKQQ